MTGGTLPLHFSAQYSAGNEPLVIDSIWYLLPENETLSVLSNSLGEGIYVGDAIQNHILRLSFDAQMPPFYLQEIRMYKKIGSTINMTIAYVYFTPWNTIEIWNEQTLPVDYRNWIAPVEGVVPTRVPIDPDTLPLPPDTTLPICWKQIDGLAFEVPVNCDTTDQEEPQGLFGFNWFVKTFRGTAKGRLVYQYNNEAGVTVNIPIAHARVEVRSGYRLEIGETDANGYFSIGWEKTTINTSGNIDLQFINEWRCVTQAEKLLLDEEITYNDFEIMLLNCKGETDLFRKKDNLMTKDGAIEAEMQLYPNPNNGTFNIDVQNLMGKKAELKIKSINGKLLFKKELIISDEGNINEKLDLSNYSKGIFFIHLKTANQSMVEKLVIQ